MKKYQKLRHPPRKLLACFWKEDGYGNRIGMEKITVEFEGYTGDGTVEYLVLPPDATEPCDARSFSNFARIEYAHRDQHTVSLDFSAY